MVFTRSKLNELSKEELIEELLSFDNLSEKMMNFLSCRFPKPVTHYYANELLIWSDHPWIILNI